MKVTGNKLYELLQLWTARKDALQAEFDDSLMMFEGQTKRSPKAIDEELVKAEEAIVQIQELQRLYNTRVVNHDRSLAVAIKQLGILKRASKRWTTVIQNRGTDGYARSKDTDYAKPNIETAEAKKVSEQYMKALLALRAEVGDANGLGIEMEIPAALLS